ncbi:MAG: ABC transporter permease [Verrucomicrobiota bacterium]
MNEVGTTDRPARLATERTEDGHFVVALSGDWIAQQGSVQDLTQVERELAAASLPLVVRFDPSRLGKWDSTLVAFALNCSHLCERLRIRFAMETLPPGVQRLVRLAQAVPEKRDAQRFEQPLGPLHRLGEMVWRGFDGAQAGLTFLGEVILAFGRLARGSAQFRWLDAVVVMQECGPRALGVVALINFLVGLILAFVGAIQLAQFGASIYIADLVAIATVREMGCLMTGIILCGRTGAAFAAQLGTMKVSEEIDAYRTFGISPYEFLVLPRVVALVAMMPVLCVFADLIAIAGGFVVSIAMLDVSGVVYIDRTISAITLRSFALGLGKSAVFGGLVAMTGCLRGLSSGDSAAAVGLATTSAVVTGITAIIAADGVFAVVCYVLGI